jgi:outer membrane biosynthesis protein TonB
VTPAERTFIQEHVRRRFGYNRALLNRAEALSAHYESAAIDTEACFRQIKQRFTPAHRAALLDFARQIVAASGHGDQAAAAFLHALAQRLGAQPVKPAPQPPPPMPMPPPPAASQGPPAVTSAAPRPGPSVRSPTAPAVATPRRPVPPPAPPPAPAPAPARTPEPTRGECLALLDIAPTSALSADLVRRQWNLLAGRLAPDKVATMGPEFVKLAEAKVAAVRRAAETLLGPMGERLETEPAHPPAKDLRHNPDLDDVFGGM